MFTTRTLILSFGLMALILSGASSQPPKEKGDKKDPQQAIEPKSAPGAGQKFLEKFTGDWAVQKKFFPRDGGEPRVQKGTCKQEMIHNGRFLKSDFIFESESGQSTGTGVMGYEPETGFFTSTWIDSRQTKMSFRKSQVKFDGTRIELLGVNLATETEGRKSKTVTTLSSDGKIITHRQLSINPDNTERPVMELVLTKVDMKAK